MNLQRFDNDGIELLIDNETGEVFASISGYARMVGKSRGTISNRLKGCQYDDLKTAQIHTGGGLQGVALIPESLIKKWVIKDNSELAEKMFEAGVRVFLYGMAGYKVQIQKAEDVTLQSLQTSMDAVMMAMQELTKEVTDFRQYKVTTENHYPGMVEFNRHLAELPALPTSELITVKQWLAASKKVTPEKGKLIGFAQRVSSMYRSATYKDPQQVFTDDGTCLGFGYPIEAYPILEQAFHAFF